MQVIQLDTPQLDVLARTRIQDPARYTAFLATWRGQERTLVFTRAELSETVRYGDQQRREARVAVLRDLLPIRSDILTGPQAIQGTLPPPRTMLERELLAHLLRIGAVSVPGVDAKELVQWSDILPGRFASPDDLQLLSLLTDDVFRSMYELEARAAEQSAAAETRPAGAPYPQARLRDLGSEPMSEEAVAKMIADFDSEFSKGSVVPDGEPLLDPKIVESIADQLKAQAHAFIRRMGEVGSQQALKETLAVSSIALPSAESPKTHVDRLVVRSVFEQQVRMFFTEVLQAPDREYATLAINHLRLEDCPGSWLQATVKERVQIGTPNPKSSNMRDLQRIGFLPYVDLFFTDGEMANFIRQALRPTDRPSPLGKVGSVVTVPRSIDSIARAIT